MNQNVSLLDIVRLIEGKSNEERCQQALKILTFSSFKPFLEPYRLKLSSGNNIVLRVNEGEKEVLMTGHYDAVKGSPGANDNASCIAAIYGLLQKISEDSDFTQPLRVVIFADEENGLKGSRGYIKRHGTEKIKVVINMELVGRGDLFIIWPVSRINENHLLIEAMEASAKELQVGLIKGNGLVRFIGDHQPFLNAGIEGCICLSMFSSGDVDNIEWYANQRYSKPGEDNKGREIPEIFKTYHSPEDISSHLSEESLRLTAEFLYRVVKKL